MQHSLDGNAIGCAAPVASDDSVFKKVAWRVVPFLFLCYVASVVDRINIGFVQLQMKHEFSFSDAMYGLSAAVFYLVYVLCEVPSIHSRIYT
ncbi:hypothetical protein SAMN05445850_7273 [Paraburkholderia tuberum]|uniref:Uncharacterized protein n=1 Tax=Paraburkholderia tuberum TaxID=157910 RepID=A0A1H1KEV6_9BURK|nr:hypothetical protein SAMN05445850_7273 [Paraburkholderia tuberum]